LIIFFKFKIFFKKKTAFLYLLFLQLKDILGKEQRCITIPNDIDVVKTLVRGIVAHLSEQDQNLPNPFANNTVLQNRKKTNSDRKFLINSGNDERLQYFVFGASVILFAAALTQIGFKYFKRN
jgi:hypothetical protein